MNHTYTPAITANIQALAAVLRQACDRAEEATQVIGEGSNNRNQAIGTISGLDELIAAAQALYGAAVTLHRQ